MSSAILNASIMLVRFSATCNSLSLGMLMRESTFSLRRLMPSSAYVERLRPSKAKGRVTTPTVSAPESLAILATTGAAPVPVPPPLPAVTKTMSAPRIASSISALFSSAASIPIFGSAPAPRPRVIFSPMWIFWSASHIWRACIRVYRYELNPLQTGVDHAVHGVGPPSANADNLYDRQIISRRVQHAYLTLHHTFFEAHGFYLPRNQPLTASTMLPKLCVPAPLPFGLGSSFLAEKYNRPTAVAY